MRDRFSFIMLPDFQGCTRIMVLSDGLKPMVEQIFDVFKDKETGGKGKPGSKGQSLDEVGTARKINKYSIL